MVANASPPAARGSGYPRDSMPFGIGWVEILILLLVALLVFGPKRLPEMGRSLGRGLREFKDSVTGKDEDERTLPPPRAPEDEATVASTAGERESRT
jgi:sec-independent protein translocase protein TatA